MPHDNSTPTEKALNDIRCCRNIIHWSVRTGHVFFCRLQLSAAASLSVSSKILRSARSSSSSLSASSSQFRKNESFFFLPGDKLKSFSRSFATDEPGVDDSDAEMRASRVLLECYWKKESIEVQRYNTRISCRRFNGPVIDYVVNININLRDL